jgi:hypothetical protein
MISSFFFFSFSQERTMSTMSVSTFWFNWVTWRVSLSEMAHSATVLSGRQVRFDR